MEESQVSDTSTQPEQPANKNSKVFLIIASVIALAILTGLVFLIINLSASTSTETGKIRDIFLILLSIEFLVIGVALVILIIQLASLINLLQNEVRPILISTKEAVANLKGTTRFLSDNMVEPVIKLNEYLAGIKKFVDIVNIFK